MQYGLTNKISAHNYPSVILLFLDLLKTFRPLSTPALFIWCCNCNFVYTTYRLSGFSIKPAHESPG